MPPPPPPPGALVHAVPFEVNTFPDGPGATEISAPSADGKVMVMSLLVTGAASVTFPVPVGLLWIFTLLIRFLSVRRLPLAVVES